MIDDERAPATVTDAMIARRAFEIWLVDGSRPPEDNWLQAERELREELDGGGQANGAA
jgi:hypothetical protein